MDNPISICSNRGGLVQFERSRRIHGPSLPQVDLFPRLWIHPDATATNRNWCRERNDHFIILLFLITLSPLFVRVVVIVVLAVGVQHRPDFCRPVEACQRVPPARKPFHLTQGRGSVGKQRWLPAIISRSIRLFLLVASSSSAEYSL